MIPIPIPMPIQSLLSDRRWPLHLLVGLMAAASGYWWWSRRLTSVHTPRSLERWRQRLGPDDGAREARATSWATLHDGLLSMRLRQRGMRTEREGTRLCVELARFVLAANAWLDATEAFSALPANETAVRWLFGRRTTGALVIGAVGAADLALASQAIGAVNRTLTDRGALAVSLPLALAFVVLGRLVASELLEQTRPRLRGALAGCAIVMLAAVMASLRRDGRTAWFVIALMPATVSIVATLLAHPGSVSYEHAMNDLTAARWRLRWRLWRLERRLAAAAVSRASLSFGAAARVVAKPHVALSGLEAVSGSAIDGTKDVTEVLTILGTLTTARRVPDAQRIIGLLAALDDRTQPNAERDRHQLRRIA